MVNLVPQSFEKNLCDLAGAKTVRHALSRMGLISRPLAEVVLEEVQGWRPGGAETYIYRFRIVTAKQNKDLIVKAVVAFSPATSLSELTSEWIRRRRHLERGGVRTPELYFSTGAYLIEDFIPYKLSDLLRSTLKNRTSICRQVLEFAGVLEKEGFRPIGAFDDLRTDGVNVFAVDFGEDIGPPGVASRHDGQLLDDAIDWLNDNRGPGDPIEITRARTIFELASRSSVRSDSHERVL